jgi:hypothetical protein
MSWARDSIGTPLRQPEWGFLGPDPAAHLHGKLIPASVPTGAKTR